MANYDVNYDDERFTQVETDKDEALTELEQTYGGMLGEADKYYDAQIEASKQWADTQTELQNQQTAHTIDQINQQKDQTYKDYVKEQSGAYVDWRKQSNQYGAEAEKMASSGLANTGYSESSQVGMYNTYQNRVASARETYNKAVLNYDNAIKDAQLQNSSILAEIAQKSLEQQLALSLEGFQYKNSLLLEKIDKTNELKNTYYQRYLDVLNQINHENDFAFQQEQCAEQNRQFNLQYEESVRQFNQTYELQKQEFEESIRQFNEEIARLKAKDAQEYQMEIERLELQKQQIAQEQANWEKEMAFKREQLAEEKRQFDESLKASTNSYSSGSTAKSSKSSNSPSGNTVKQYTDTGTGSHVSTSYYQGSLNSDAREYGTFSNGYQPKGISGHGTLKKTGDTMIITATVKYGPDKGKVQKLEQNVWKAEDGTKWYWDGSKNKYIQYK